MAATVNMMRGMSLGRQGLALKEKLLLRLPISVYFGWLTIAVIANITTFLVSIGFDGFGIPENAWTAAILLIGAVIGVLTTLKNKDAAYGLVIIWAFAGIFVQHLSPSGFNSRYPLVIGTVIFALACMAAAVTASFIMALRKKPQ